MAAIQPPGTPSTPATVASVGERCIGLTYAAALTTGTSGFNESSREDSLAGSPGEGESESSIGPTSAVESLPRQGVSAGPRAPEGSTTRGSFEGVLGPSHGLPCSPSAGART